MANTEAAQTAATTETAVTEKLGEASHAVTQEELSKPSETTAEAKPAEAAPPKTYTQEDLDRITAKVKKNAAYRARKEAEAYYKGLQQGTQVGRPQEPQRQEPAAPREPKREDFNDYESFIEARAEWRADRRVDERLAKQREADAQRTAGTEQEKAQRRFMDDVAALAKEIPDIQEVLETSDAPLTKTMQDAIHASDAPARIAHYLAANPDEAQRISALPSAKQAVEIGKLEASLVKAKPNGADPSTTATTIASAAGAAARVPPKAPAPINPVGGKVAAADDMPDAGKEPEKWIAWRNRQLRSRMSVGNTRK